MFVTPAGGATTLVRCSRKFIQRCQDRCLRAIPWAVNDPDRMRDLMERGVGGIISDYPNRLCPAYRESRESQ